MTALAKTNMVGAPAALVPRSVEEARTFAELFAKSALAPEALRGKPADIFMILAYGLEVGLPPVAALRSVAIIKGKPAPHADALVAIVLASGHAKFFRRISSSDTEATYETWRQGDPEARRETFTMEQAKQAGLHSNHSWKSWPKKMLEARAKAFLARDVYPDVCAGIYVAEEVQDFQDDEKPGKVIEAQFVAPPAPGANTSELAAQVYAEVKAANDPPKPKASRKKREAAPPTEPAHETVDVAGLLAGDPELAGLAADHIICRMAECTRLDLANEMKGELGQLRPPEYELAKTVWKAHYPHLDTGKKCDCYALALSNLVPLLAKGGAE